MWKLGKFFIFSKRQYDSSNSVQRRNINKLLYVSAMIAKKNNVEENILEEIFIPSNYKNDDKSIDILLSGFFFIKFKDEYLPLVERIFSDAKLFLDRSPVTEEQVNDIKCAILENTSVKIDNNLLKLGDTVEVPSVGINTGKIVAIENNIITVSFFLFGQDNTMSVEISDVKKI